MIPLAAAPLPAATLPAPTAFALAPNAALLAPLALPRKPTATAKLLVAPDEIPMAMLPCPQSVASLPPAQGWVASWVKAWLSGPMAIPPMAVACAAPASESLMPTAAKPLASPFPRVSASPGLDSRNCIGTIAPTASNTAIRLLDMHDMITPCALSPIGRAKARGQVSQTAAVKANGRTDKIRGYPAPAQASNHRVMSGACHAAQQLCRRRCSRAQSSSLLALRLSLSSGAGRAPLPQAVQRRLRFGREQFGQRLGAAGIASLQVGETRVHELDAAAHHRLELVGRGG